MKEKRAKVTFELEPMGSTTKLTVTHGGFQGNTEMLKGVSHGWPAILSRLKTMLETGEVSPWPAGDRQEVAAE